MDQALADALTSNRSSEPHLELQLGAEGAVHQMDCGSVAASGQLVRMQAVMETAATARWRITLAVAGWWGLWMWPWPVGVGRAVHTGQWHSGGLPVVIAVIVGGRSLLTAWM